MDAAYRRGWNDYNDGTCLLEKNSKGEWVWENTGRKPEPKEQEWVKSYLSGWSACACEDAAHESTVLADAENGVGLEKFYDNQSHEV